LSDNAYTLNEQGLNLVPLDVTIKNNDVFIHAADPDYANPGPEEVRKFD
jgi:arylsulfatase